MHIVIAIVTAIGVIAAWYYRLKMIGGAARDVARVADRVVNMPRKFSFMRRAAHTGLKAVDDPREAAAILMVLVAGGEGGNELTDHQRAVIMEETAEQFDLDEEEAEALLVHAQWMVRDVQVPAGVGERMARIVITTPGIGPKELVDLDAMLVAVSEADGTAGSEGLKMLQVFRDQAGLRA
ncbi:MAG: hypothetical protein AAFY34_02850 [Pseudomonadota bacterium]